MADRLARAPDPLRILSLARRDRSGASRALEALSEPQQLAVVCEAPPERRVELLGLLPAPERIIPLLPEAELCFTVKAVGLEDAVWLLDYATPQQIVASVDLDAWSGALPDRARLDVWFDALAQTRPEALRQALRSLDPELLVLYLRNRVDVEMKPSGDDDWQPPVGGQTLDGQFYFVARREGDDVEALLGALRTLFESDYWTYFRMLQGSIWELDSELEEWALRWRAGRLEDLGFPPWEEAMRVYGYVPPHRLADVPEERNPLDVGAWRLPVWAPSLPAAPDARETLFRAIAELEAPERTGAFYALVALANKVAVADRMPLGDAESIPRALAKAVRLADGGLEFVVKERGLDPVQVLRRVSLERLFRVGANLDPEGAKPSLAPVDESS